MSKRSYGSQFFMYSMIFAAPLVVLAVISAANAGPKGTNGKELPKPKPIDLIPKALRDWFDIPADAGGGKKPDTATFAGWYSYRGRWIRVDEFPEAAVVEIATLPVWMPAPSTSGVTDKVVYKGRFRWTVMHTGEVGSPPLSQGESTETGTASRALSFGDAAELTAEARDVAIGEAAAEASQWIDVFEGGGIQ